GAQEPAPGRRKPGVLDQGREHRADAAARRAHRPARGVRRRQAEESGMNARLAAILVVLLVILGGGALLYQYQERTQRPANSDVLGRPLLKDLKAAEVASIRIVGPKATLTVRQKEERWVLAERGDFPADVAKVRDFVVQALSLKVGQSEPIGDKDRARLNLDESATQVEFGGADGKPLSKLVVGKKYFKREVDNPDKARADGRFVALPGEPKMVYV